MKTDFPTLPPVPYNERIGKSTAWPQPNHYPSRKTLLKKDANENLSNLKKQVQILLARIMECMKKSLSVSSQIHLIVGSKKSTGWLQFN